METFQSQLGRKLTAALIRAGLPAGAEVSPATDRRFGDYQTNAALLLAKQRGENPRALAARILEQLEVSDICKQPVIAGGGFINFTLKPQAVERAVAELLPDRDLGVRKTSEPKRIVIDFGSPNVAKPMHIGHVRSTFLGDALARIAQFVGHEVIRDNHIGDWGTQFGMVIWGWKHLLDHDALAHNPIAELVRVYKETNERAGKEEAIRNAARGELVKLQAGDQENVAIWQRTVAISKQEFERAYALLNIHYDLQHGESYYNDRLRGVVERLLKSGLAEMSEGAVCVFFRDIPELADKPAIIQKRDGGFNYTTTDIATVDYRMRELKADSIWIVTGAPQQLHFKQIFEIARREGYRADFRHITNGNILGADRKLMKTRSGENVPLLEVLDEAIARARRVIEEKNPNLNAAEKSTIARTVGIGAVKYADLSQYRMTDYVFSFDRMLSLQGNTAPYLQNAYVRIRSIFRKADATTAASPADRGQESTSARALILSEPAELDLAKRLCQFGEVVPQVLNDFRPNILTNYLFELANSFHAFYEACPVLKADALIRSSRMALSDLTGRVLKTGLNLLGIGVPEKM